MQSFMPMEVVAFTDSDINEVYVPTNQTWLQGSDYDRVTCHNKTSLIAGNSLETYKLQHKI